MNRNVLLMDNSEESLELYGRALKRAGYVVLKAQSVAIARDILDNENIHAAVCDIRMEDEDDARDLSGLIIAKDSKYISIPKIILTGYPSYHSVKTALGPDTKGITAAVDFIAKSEGTRAVVEALNRVFELHINVNWELDICKNVSLSVGTILSMLSQTEGRLRSGQLIEECEDVLRRMFLTAKRIRLARLLWNKSGYACFTVNVFREPVDDLCGICVLGTKDALCDRLDAMGNVFDVPASGKAPQIVLAETTHFCGIALLLEHVIEDELEPIASLHGQKRFSLGIGAMAQIPQRTQVDKRAIMGWSQLLQQLWHANSSELNAAIARCFDCLSNLTSSIGVAIEKESGKIRMRSHGQICELPDPCNKQLAAICEKAAKSTTALNIVDAETIIVDGAGSLILTDAAIRAEAPGFWNYAVIEAKLRYDVFIPRDLIGAQRFESYLVNRNNEKSRVVEMELGSRRIINSLQVIRRAASYGSAESEMYNESILALAISKLLEYEQVKYITTGELWRAVHLLMSIAMLCAGNIKRSSDHLATRKNGIFIDFNERQVFVNGNQVRISGQAFSLLSYLYEHRSHLCTRRELIENVYKMEYDQTDNSQVSRLNTAIYRIRERIEDDPERPRYLLTDPGGGYRLT